MVYIDVRDRKFQLIVLLPIVIGAIFALLVLVDQPDSIDFIAVALGLWVALWFVVFLVFNFVQEKMREREGESTEE